MDFIYQYMGLDKCLSIIRNKALPLRYFLSYNDPFECVPEFLNYADLLPIYSASNEKQREEMIIKQIDIIGRRYKLSEDELSGIKQGILASSLLQFGLFPVSVAYVIGASLNMYFNSELHTKDQKSVANKIELFISNFIPYLSNLYTSCFSKVKDNILMWSHYANAHKGVVVVFNPEYKPFTIGCLKEMTYSDTRFDFSIKDYQKSDMDNLVKKLLTTKGNAWIYEEEQRLILDIKTNKDEVVWRDYYNNPYVRLDEECIECIYIGRRMPEMDKQLLQNALLENGLDSKIKLSGVKLSHTGYVLEFDEDNTSS